MIYIDATKRSPIILFKTYLYQYMKKNNLHYTKQREQVLKSLHSLSNSVNIQTLVEIINREGCCCMGHGTMALHINFYKQIGWLKSINGIHNQYILIKDATPIRNSTDQT